MKTVTWYYRSYKCKRLSYIWSTLLLIILNDVRQTVINSNNVFGADALRVRGEFDLSQDFFLFLAKFGFQKTDIQDPNNTQGVIYGNISLVLTQDASEDNINESETSYSYDQSSGINLIITLSISYNFYTSISANNS